jgi:hypothetical protein
MVRYENLKFLNYLNSLDLLNKYNYINYYLIPFFDKISLKIFLKGLVTPNLINIYLKNFLLLYLYCFNFIYSKIKFIKQKKKKLKTFKINILLYYSIMKKKIYFSIFNFFFLFKKFIRPFFFSQFPLKYSFSSGKLIFFYIKVIIFIPSFILLDFKEHRIFSTFKKSKIFLTLTLKCLVTTVFYNFFIKIKKIKQKILKNFLLIWLFNI